MALSYNGFQVLNSKSISEFFAFSANISIFSILILVILLRSFGKYIAIIVFFIKFTIGRSYDDIIFLIINIFFKFNIFFFAVYILIGRLKLIFLYIYQEY